MIILMATLSLAVPIVGSSLLYTIFIDLRSFQESKDSVNISSESIG